ncbi:MAG: cyclic nucleotide-binding domain-containing protein [Myxococcaceae bacterium]|nr:cyclic nucleotide-binding domain-containing protein [Myxococcaceae bacterium]
MSRIARSEVIVPKALSPEARHQLIDALYAVHEEIFDGVEREAFAKYVVESKAEHTWLQIHKNEAGSIVGYFALHIFEREFGGKPTAVFRAEAGSLRAYRGGSITMRFGLRRVLSYLLRNPRRTAWYLGSLVHPSSYMLLANHFGAVWPHREQATPPEVLSFMDSLASEFSLERVDPSNPLVRKVGWRTREAEAEREYWQHCDKPAARFFVEANPGYTQGHGLMTLVPLTADSVLHLARVVSERALRRPLEACRALVQRLPGAARIRRTAVMRLLQASPPFAHFDQRVLAALASGTELLSLPAGRYVVHAGDSCDGLYLLARGAAYVLMPNGHEEELVDELGSGSVFGEIAMLAGERRSASIRTATASVLVRIPREALLPVMATHASLRQEVWRVFAARRFDDVVRELPSYSQLGRKKRLALPLQGEHRELEASEEVSIMPGTTLFVLSGSMMLEAERMKLATRGPALLEAHQPLCAGARERSRVILLPRMALAEPSSEPALVA